MQELQTVIKEGWPHEKQAEFRKDGYFGIIFGKIDVLSLLHLEHIHFSIFIVLTRALEHASGVLRIVYFGWTLQRK